jgi:hypothetical protein
MAGLSANGAPVRNDGIRTVADLRDRCRIDTLTNCWVWAHGRNSDGRVSAWIPALQARGSLGTLIAILKTGQRPKPGTAWHPICTTPDCANPAHRIEGTRSSQMSALVGVKRSPQTRARMVISRRKFRKLSDEDVQAIRVSEEPLKVLAERYGVHMNYVSEVRSGRQRRAPIAPGASVFAWAGGAA